MMGVAACQCHPIYCLDRTGQSCEHIHTVWSPALANASAKDLRSTSNRAEHPICTSLAATRLLFTRVTRITHRGCSASPQVSIDSSLRSFRSCCDGELLLCVSSGAARASDFHVLRQHDQRHEHSARHRLSVNFLHCCTDPCSTPECAERLQSRSTEVGEKTQASPLRTSIRRSTCQSQAKKKTSEVQNSRLVRP